jgi:hypothetical protein
MAIISQSGKMFFFAQKFSISCVSAMPPIGEPDRRRRPISSGSVLCSSISPSWPTITSVASTSSSGM